MTPFINSSEVWNGFLESLLGVKLEARTSNPLPVFEIKKLKTATKTVIHVFGFLFLEQRD
jgi:hypothetical protein